MKLEEVIPPNPEFILSDTGKTYHLRLPNLEDRARFQEMFTTKEMEEVFNKLQWGEICRIAFRLLKEKEEFRAVEFKAIDDNGYEQTVTLTGPQVLLRRLSNIDEATRLLTAVTRAFIDSEPMIKPALELDIKKNMEKEIKKQTGPKSSTPSRASTVTP